MLGLSTLNKVFTNVIATGLVSEVFHSVIIRDDGTGQKKPSAPVDTKFIYVGIDDREGFHGYCRAVSPLEVYREEKIGPGNWITYYRIMNRLVFHNGIEHRSHDGLAGILTNAVLGVAGVKLNKLYTNAEDFLRQEQPTGSFSLKTGEFYIAIDFYFYAAAVKNYCEPGEGAPGGQFSLTEELTCGPENPFCLP